MRPLADLLEAAAKAHPQARTTADFEELLADPELDAVVIATPVVTHYELAKQALLAGKHVFVEKPQAQSSAEAEELAALAEEQGLVLMPGYLLLYHPAVQRLKEVIDGGELGDVLYLYGNRQNLGQIRRDENALWSIGAQDLSMILHLVDEEPSRPGRAASPSCAAGSRTSSSATCASRPGSSRTCTSRGSTRTRCAS